MLLTVVPLAAKAEVVLGMLLTVRHRAVRLAGLLCVVVIGLGVFDEGEPELARQYQTVLLVGGSLAAVGGSRLFAPGAALAALRRSAGPWWLAPVGRLVGVLLVVWPLVGIGTGALAGPSADWQTATRLGLIAGLHAAAVAALTLALAPALGATAAGTLGLSAAWLGGIPPSGVLELFGGWSYVQRPAVLLWNVLPLNWRAARWFRAGTVEDLLVLGGWVVLGVMLAAWSAGCVYRGERPAEERA
ncbi:MAG: hypothetical protein GTN62_00805 [Gemmatimonadales bacterium]|nr:hypothetical protein [Gemmatimonadales bacterium]NIN48642.1 hypothetical protein [Gemmatimonadales bacterium]NIP06106.1 hypothetical protein [Gemmatimonadales bacterium]NIR01280.1 hypothetical protein [Gemmatimonadales bacterium]